MIKFTTQETSESAEKLQKLYKDLDCNLEMELQFQALFSVLMECDPEHEKTKASDEPIDENVRKYFPNIELILGIYSTLPMTNYIGERSFWKLKIMRHHH